MTSLEFVNKFNKLQDKTCSKLIAKIGFGGNVYICRFGVSKELVLFAYSTPLGYWAFVNQEDCVFVTPKTLKLMAKFLKSTYKNSRK